MTPSQKDALELADKLKKLNSEGEYARLDYDDSFILLAAWVHELQAENEEINKRRWELEQHVGVMNAKGFKEVITSRIEEVQKARECAEKAESRIKSLEEKLGVARDTFKGFSTHRDSSTKIYHGDCETCLEYINAIVRLAEER